MDTKEAPVPAAPEDEMTESGQIDFGFSETTRVDLPDGKSWVEIKTLTEGDRRKYQNALNRDVRIDRAKGDMHMKIQSGDERKALLMAAIDNWNLTRNGKAVKCDDPQKREFIDGGNPRIIDLIEKEIRKNNSWLQQDMSVEDIQREIDSLEELKQQKLDEEAAKNS